MKVKKKPKAPKQDYGLFCFRLSEGERKELNSLLNKAKVRINSGRTDDEYVITKNQILFEAIQLGLPLVKREK